MRNFIKLSVFFAVLFAVLSCASERKMADSKIIVTPLSGAMNITEGSLVYGLPLTVIDVRIEAERVIERPGPYARYAESLLGLKDVIEGESETWAITGVTIKSHEEPDPSEFYVIQTSSLFQTNVLSLKKTGLMLDLNPETYNRTEEESYDGNADLNVLRVSDLGADEYFRSSSDTVYKLVSFDTAFVNIPYLVEKKQKLSVAQLAEKAAVRLMEMRDGKHMILTGETNVFPQDGAAINEMNRLEKDYTDLFTGKTVREKRAFSYHVIPGKDRAGEKITLCRFSEVSGPLAADAAGGTPLVLELMPEAKTKNLTIITTGKQQGSSASKYDRLYYRVPDVANIKITFGNEIFKVSRRLIYQFGDVVQLPSNYIIGK